MKMTDIFPTQQSLQNYLNSAKTYLADDGGLDGCEMNALANLFQQMSDEQQAYVSARLPQEVLPVVWSSDRYECGPGIWD